MIGCHAVNTRHGVRALGGINVFDCLGVNKEKEKKKLQGWSNKEEVEKREGGEGCE